MRTQCSGEAHRLFALSHSGRYPPPVGSGDPARCAAGRISEGERMSRLPSSPRPYRRRKRLSIMSAAAVTTLALASAALAAVPGSWGSDQVGSDDGKGILLPDQQRVTPAGTRHLVSDGRLLSSALSPDGNKMALLSGLATRGYLTVIDVSSGNVLQQLDLAAGTGAGSGFGDGTVAAAGPLYSPDGTTLSL